MTHGSASLLSRYMFYRTLINTHSDIIIIRLCLRSPAPCTPRDLTTYVQCELSTGSVSWGSSDGAKMYTATATGLDGHVHPCHTNATYCSWDDLHCGEEYTVVVRAHGYNCSSRASNSTLISMSMYDIIKTSLLCWTCLWFYGFLSTRLLIITLRRYSSIFPCFPFFFRSLPTQELVSLCELQHACHLSQLGCQ